MPAPVSELRRVARPNVTITRSVTHRGAFVVSCAHCAWWKRTTDAATAQQWKQAHARDHQQAGAR